MPYLKQINEDGDVQCLGKDAIIGILSSLEDEFYDAAYDVVATVLRVDLDLKEYMLPMDVIEATTQIAEQIPEIINEAEAFFG